MDVTIIMIDLTAISSKFRRVIIGSLICFAHESIHEFPKKYFLNMFNVSVVLGLSYLHVHVHLSTHVSIHGHGQSR